MFNFIKEFDGTVRKIAYEGEGASCSSSNFTGVCMCSKYFEEFVNMCDDT